MMKGKEKKQRVATYDWSIPIVKIFYFATVVCGGMVWFFLRTFYLRYKQKKHTKHTTKPVKI